MEQKNHKSKHLVGVGRKTGETAQCIGALAEDSFIAQPPVTPALGYLMPLLASEDTGTHGHTCEHTDIHTIKSKNIIFIYTKHLSDTSVAAQPDHRA